ncbi:hypothetical protein BH24ACT12_BH24ACT12_14130 [soil metagenome]
MTQIVQPDRSQARGLREAGERLCDVLGRQVLAAHLREHQATVDVDAAPLGALAVLPQPVLEQGARGAAIELHDAVLPGPGLWGPESGAAADLDQLAAHDDHTGLEFDVRPLQSEGLTAA